MILMDNNGVLGCGIEGRRWCGRAAEKRGKENRRICQVLQVTEQMPQTQNDLRRYHERYRPSTVYVIRNTSCACFGLFMHADRSWESNILASLCERMAKHLPGSCIAGLEQTILLH